jgi:hypothetical protein
MSIRKGAPKAVIALAHHMITVVHQVLSRKEEYVELGGDYYDQRNKPKTAARLMARLEKLGYQVEVKVIRDAAPAESALPAAHAEADSGGKPLRQEPEQPKRRKGRPCKCIERGIICKHGTSIGLTPLIQQALRGEKFS